MAADFRTMTEAGSKILPGALLSLAVGVAAYMLGPYVGQALSWIFHRKIDMPVAVVALIIGMIVHSFAMQPQFSAGLTWCVKTLLRIAVALLGLRIAVGDLLGLGIGTVALVVISMAATLAAGFGLARYFERDPGYGALAGAATAICGASAALATAMVLPDYKRRNEDLALTVILANLVSTIVMVLYPLLAQAFGLSDRATGVLLGATIHDMAQAAGSGYSVSLPVGDVTVVVKMLRVFLLVPALLVVGWWFRHQAVSAGAAPGAATSVSLKPPGFAMAFVVLCLVNSLLEAVPGLKGAYGPIKGLLSQFSTWTLLVAIAALGLGTSLTSILRVDVRHILVFTGTTLTILAVAGVALKVFGIA